MQNAVVSEQEWLTARKALLVSECAKAATAVPENRTAI
jgi:predicted dithiol-disulfide oxidoreductase (DUF899 family)